MRTSTSTSITDIDPAAWDALDQGGSPFLRHAFLAALEETGCVGRRTGWQPAPITLYDEHGLAAAARPRSSCNVTGAGSQPVSGPTQPVDSSVARNA